MSEGLNTGLASGTFVINNIVDGISGFILKFVTIETFIILFIIGGIIFALFMMWKEEVSRKNHYYNRYREI